MLTQMSLIFALTAPIGLSIEPGLPSIQLVQSEISQAALALIKKGEVEILRARSLRERAAVLKSELERLNNAKPESSAYRSLGSDGAQGDTEAKKVALEGLIEHILGQVKQSETVATQAWEEAIAIDASAQETILMRLLGTKPKN